jgi:AcrR family transcriptional regulator
MSKGEQTRQMILERSARLFSRKGYFGSSLSDIMAETGLEKGGIYNHFGSKDALALEAFDYAFGLVWRRLDAELEGKAHAADRLLAHVTLVRGLIERPLLPGGCPLLNTAVEADDSHLALRRRAREAMSRWRDRIRETAVEGIARGELRREVDPDALATVLIATMEGAVMLSKLYRDPAHIRHAADHLTAHINSAVRA